MANILFSSSLQVTHHLKTQTEVWRTFIDKKMDINISQSTWLSHVRQGIRYTQLCRAGSFYFLILAVKAGRVSYLNSLQDNYGGALCEMLLNPHQGMLQQV